MAPRDDASSESDAEMLEGDSDIEYTEQNGGEQGKGKGKDKEKKGKGKGKDTGYAWEANYTRSWDQVQEDEGGSLLHSVEDLIARNRRKRLLGPGSAVRRAIIRHLVLLIDLSAAMMDRDLRPSRFELALDCARAFVSEWCEQNPLGQIGVVGMRAGIGERVVEMTGNPHDVLRAIADKRKLEPAGEPSLQNAIEVARAGMRQPPTCAFVERNSCHDKIRISVVALAAEMKICKELCAKTDGKFGVAMNEGHFKDLLFEHIPPPAHRGAPKNNDPGVPPRQVASLNPTADLMMMGFPTRLPPTSAPTLCVCHPSRLRAEGFICPRCSAKLCEVPTDCDVCGLMVVSSPHLARSYHHLFPVRPYVAINEVANDENPEAACQGCTAEFRTDGSHSVPAAADGIIAPGSPFSPTAFSLLQLPPPAMILSSVVALALGATLPLSVFAGNVTEGGQCSTANTYLTPGSYQLNTDCDSKTYCTGSGVCAKKRCRKDEWPFGYKDVQPKDYPKMCPSTQFCPDEEDDCQDLLAVGSPCQLNRDDECQPSSDSSISTPDNHKGAICLNYQCMWQNVTVGQACVVENIPYIAYSSQGEFINIVSRGNCRPGLYCDAAQKICIATQDLGSACTADKECTSGNCLDDLTCGYPTDAPRQLGTWVYVVVGVAIFGGMLLTLGTLFMFHRKHRDEMRQQREQYWREQAALRQNILQMRETAQASLLSLPYNGQNQSGSGSNSPSRHSSFASGKDIGVASDDSHAGFVTHAGYAGGKGGSGLRNSLRSDDGQDAMDEAMSMEALVTEKEHGTQGRRRTNPLSMVGKR
ncbi:suppressor of stem-loop protein 1 [Ceratobasidium sp. AG-Ba]|nr:suppressor of stem-loop protein 1 [Ceratobasidium sp. AG-Ba]